MMEKPKIVSQAEWLAARESLLAEEKRITRDVTRWPPSAGECRGSPWRSSTSDGPDGKASLLDLFEGDRVQLIVYRAFFEPGVFGWPDHACRAAPSEPTRSAILSHLRPRYHSCLRLARAAAGHPAPEGAHGMEDALVHHYRQLRR